MTKKRNYRIIDHTADVGIEVYGGDLSELMEHAGEALFSIITDIEYVETSVSHNITVAPGENEEVLRNWLEQLLQYFNTDDMLFSRFEVILADDGFFRCTAAGEKIDSDRHLFHTEIKGITYHQFEVSGDESGWQARIILDV
ncbi:MAG: archease [Candidatus Marinimicrobia bacterium]|nr:archease [Candidatus Neomarinimicrobiota bacterium]MDP6593640.1 archease [Candidatus Neomarinimicrobiota bacterium]MDP6836190.1 archease [Candidatus Neomarinimicrobiota bacterium]MDP6965738.1 archease [Candidatus Neomarinimicrobiota bacterium]